MLPTSDNRKILISLIVNYGVYVCYICEGSTVNQTTDATPQSATVVITTIGLSTNSSNAEAGNSSSITTQSSTLATHTQQTFITSQSKASTTTYSTTTETTTTATASSSHSTGAVSSNTKTSSDKTKSSSTVTKSSSTSQSLTTPSGWFSQENRLVIVGASLVVGVLLCLLVGYIICTKRRTLQQHEIRRIGKICRDQDVSIQNQSMVPTPNQRSRGNEGFQTEFNRYSYVRVRGEHDTGTSQYCEIIDLEDELEQKSAGPGRRRDNETSSKTGKGTNTITAPNGSPDPGKLGLKINHSKIIERVMNMKPVPAAEEKPPRQEKSKSVFQNVDPLSNAREPVSALQKQEPTTMFTEVNLSKQKLKPVYKNVDPPRNNLEPDYSLLKQEPIPTYTEVNRSKQKLKPVYKNVDPPRNNLEPDYSLLKQEPIPTYTEVIRSKQKPKPVSKTVDTVRNDRKTDNTLLKHAPTPMYTEVKLSKQKLKPAYQNVKPDGNVPRPVNDEHRQPGQDLIPMSTEMDSPKPKPKPKPFHKKPDPPKKDSKPSYAQVKKSEVNNTGSGTTVPFPSLKDPGGKKNMATSENSFDEQEMYATHTREKNDGCFSDNDLYG